MGSQTSTNKLYQITNKSKEIGKNYEKKYLADNISVTGKTSWLDTNTLYQKINKCKEIGEENEKKHQLLLH